MSNEMRDWQADEIQELQGRTKELEAIIAIRNVRIAPEPLDMERWVQLSHCAVLEAEKTSTPDAPRNPDDTLYYWAFQTLAVQESAITDQQARIAELEEWNRYAKETIRRAIVVGGEQNERIAELEWEYASVVNQFHDELKHNTKLEAENLALAKDSNLVAAENQRLRDEIQSAIYAMSCPVSASGSGALAILRKALIQPSDGGEG